MKPVYFEITRKFFAVYLAASMALTQALPYGLAQQSDSAASENERLLEALRATMSATEPAEQAPVKPAADQPALTSEQFLSGAEDGALKAATSDEEQQLQPASVDPETDKTRTVEWTWEVERNDGDTRHNPLHSYIVGDQGTVNAYLDEKGNISKIEYLHQTKASDGGWYEMIWTLEFENPEARGMFGDIVGVVQYPDGGSAQTATLHGNLASENNQFLLFMNGAQNPGWTLTEIAEDAPETFKETGEQIAEILKNMNDRIVEDRASVGPIPGNGNLVLDLGGLDDRLAERLNPYGNVKVTDVNPNSVGGYTYLTAEDGSQIITTAFNVELENGVPSWVYIQEFEDGNIGKCLILNIIADEGGIDPNNWAVLNGRIETAVLRPDMTQESLMVAEYRSGGLYSIAITEYDADGVNVVKYTKFDFTDAIFNDEGTLVSGVVHRSVWSNDNDTAVLLSTSDLVFDGGRPLALYTTTYDESGAIVDEVVSTDEAEMDAVIQSYDKIYSYSRLQPAKIRRSYLGGLESVANAEAFARAVANSILTGQIDIRTHGDINQDGLVDEADLANVKARYENALQVLSDLSAEALEALDYDLNGVIDAADCDRLIRDIRQIIVQKVADKAFSVIGKLNSQDFITLAGAKLLRATQDELKAAIESLPVDQRAAFIKQFNLYLTQSDRLISSKPLLIQLQDGREVIVRNSPDVMAQIIRRFKMMDQNGEVKLDRLAGIGPEDLAGLETAKEYFDGRQIGSSFDLPSFDLYSPLGHLELVERLVRKYPVMNIEGPSLVLDVPAFLRHVDGTAQVYEAARAAIEKVYSEHPFAFTANPLTLAAIKKAIEDLGGLNRALGDAVNEVLDGYRGEAVFKNLVSQDILGVLNDYYHSPYSQHWRELNDALYSRAVQFEINGIVVNVARGDLNNFINHLPQDTYDLFRYPGVKTNVDPSFVPGLVGANYYNSLSSVNLGLHYAGESFNDVTDFRTVHYQIAYAAQYQVLEVMLKTWASQVVRPDGTVDFDRLRFRMLISYDLEMALGRAEEYLANQNQKMQDFGNRKFYLENCAAIYDEMKTLLAETQTELRKRFDPLLKDVIYDTFNEVTIRVSERYQSLVDSFNQVLGDVVIIIQTPQTPITFRPADINREVLEKILDAVSIRTNGYLGFSRDVYQRMNGITPEMLKDLLSPNQVNALVTFNFNNYGYGQDNYLAPQEVLFKLIPQIVQKFGTANTEELTQKLTENLPFPVQIGQSLETTLRNIISDFCRRTGAAIDSLNINNIQDLLALRDLMLNQSRAFRDALRVYTGNLSGEEISLIESWANYNGYWNGSYQESWNYVVSRFQAKVWEPVWLEVRGVRVPIRQILNIEKFPYSPVYDEKLFTGIDAGDFTDAEHAGNVNRYTYIRLNDERIDYMMSPELSALGRMQLVVNIVDRLLAMDPPPAITFDKDGVTELDPEAFRLYIKGVRAMQQAIYDEARLRTDALIEKLKALEKGAYTIDEINAMHAELLTLRQGLIEFLEKMAGQHERRDVIETEDEVSLIFQDAFEKFVEMVGKANLVIEIRGVSVVVPAKAITTALLDYIKANITETPAAHDFAKLFGIDVNMVRWAHKLENFLGEQMVVLPRNSEFVEIISQLSELGYMQLASALVKKYAGEVVVDGQVDVAKLIDLITNKDSAVAYAKKSAEEFMAGKIAAIEALNGRPFTLQDLTDLAKIYEDIRLGLVSQMNDFLSGNTDEALQKELEAYITGLYDNARKVWTNTTFEYEVNGQKIQIQLTAEMMGRFAETIRQYLLSHPGDQPAFPVGDIPLIPVGDGGMVVYKAGGGELGFDYIKPIRPIWPIDPIWVPVPRPGSFNPAYHPTVLAMVTLFCRLAVKYGDFVVKAGENGTSQFDFDSFLRELLLPDSDRANRRLEQMLAKDLPALRDYIESLKDANGALPVSVIMENDLLKSGTSLTQKFLEIKNRILALSQDNSQKAQEVWAEFMKLYENTLFSEQTLLSFDYRGTKITFSAAALDKMLMELFYANKLDQDLLNRFTDLINKGETTWQYNSFKWLKAIYYEPIFDRLPMLEGYNAGEDSDPDLTYAFDKNLTFGDLALIPGISRRDLVGLEAAEMAGRLRLTPMDPLKLMGLLDMRALAPGSGVSVGGMMKAMDMNSSAVMAETAEYRMISDVYYWKPWRGGLSYTSQRFRVLEFLPEVIKALGDIMGESFIVTDGKLNLENVRRGFEQFPSNEVEALALYHGVPVESIRSYRTDPGYCQMSIPGKCTESVFYSYLDQEGNRHYKTASFAFWKWFQSDQVPHYAWKGKKLGEVRDASAEDAFLAEGFHSLFNEQYPFENIKVTVIRHETEPNPEMEIFDLEYAVDTCPKGAEGCMAPTLIRRVTGVRKLVNGEWRYEFQKNERELKMQEVVLASLAETLGLDREQLSKLIELVQIDLEHSTVYLQFKDGKMGNARLVDVLGDGKLPTSMTYQLKVEKTPVQCFAAPCPPDIESYQIQSAQMVWSYGMNLGMEENLIANIQYENGQISKIDWAETRIGCGSNCHGDVCTAVCIPIQFTMSHTDVYAYEGSKVMIRRFNGIGLASQNMTLDVLGDGKHHITKLEEFDESGVVISAVTKFDYMEHEMVGCPNPEIYGPCQPKPAVVFLMGLQRTDADGNRLSITSLDLNTGKALVSVGDVAEAVEFANLENLLLEIRRLENEYSPVMRARKAVIAELRTNFGIDAAQLDEWLKQGLIQIHIDQLYFGTFASVVFDASIQKRMFDKSRVNLLGSFTLPARAWFSFDSEMRLQDGHLWYDGNPASISTNIHEIVIRYAEGRMSQVQLYDGPTAVCWGPGCAKPGHVVKEINYRYWPSCRGEMCTMGFFNDSAEVIYPTSDKITRRIVTFNSGGFMTFMIPPGAITSVQEFGKDASGNEVLLVNNEFVYGSGKVEDPSRCFILGKGGCVVNPGVLESIKRTDAAGNVLSVVKIGLQPRTLDSLDPGLETAEDFSGIIYLGNLATVILPDGREFQLFFKSYEQLFDQVRKIEQSSRDEVLTKPVLASLAKTFGLSLEQLSDLIGSIKVDWEQKTVDVQFKDGKMGNGRLINVLGPVDLPASIVYQFITVFAPDGSVAAYEISTAKMALKTPLADGVHSADISFNVHGDISEIVWMKDDAGAVAEAYRDSYSYDTSKIFIKRNVIIREPGVAFGDPVIHIKAIAAMTLDKLGDGKHYITSLQEFDENGKLMIAETAFHYEELIPLGKCPPDAVDCVMPLPTVILTGLKRTGMNQEWLSTTSIRTWENVGLVDVGDGQEHKVLFEDLENLLAQIREIEKEYQLVQKIRQTIIGNLVEMFGIKNADLQDWLAKGWVKINVDRKSGKAEVFFTSEQVSLREGEISETGLVGLRYSGGKVNPLGDFVIPASIQYTFAEGIRPGLWPKGFKAPMDILLKTADLKYPNGAFLGGDEQLKANTIGRIHVEFSDEPHYRRSHVWMYDVDRGIQCFQAPCPESGELVKVVDNTFFSPCAGDMCLNSMPWENSIVRYLRSLPDGVTRRTVDYNLWQEEAPQGAIRQIIDYGLDADGKEIVLAVNQLVYGEIPLGAPCQSGADGTMICPPPSYYLEKIVRRDASGNILSTISDVTTEAPKQFYMINLFEGIAAITLPNGMSKKVAYHSAEELLDLARTFEKENQNIVYRTKFGHGEFVVEQVTDEAGNVRQFGRIRVPDGNGGFTVLREFELQSYQTENLDANDPARVTRIRMDVVGGTMTAWLFLSEWPDANYLQVDQQTSFPQLIEIFRITRLETGSLTLLKLHEHISTGYGRYQTTSWDYDNSGIVNMKTITRGFYDALGSQKMVTLAVNLNPDGTVQSAKVQVSKWLGDEQTVLFEAKLTGSIQLDMVSANAAGNDWAQLFHAIRGTTEDGRLITVTVTEDGQILVSERKFFPFGDGRLVLEKTYDQDGNEKQVALIQVSDASAEGKYRTIESFEVASWNVDSQEPTPPVYDPVTDSWTAGMGHTTVTIQTTDGKTVILKSLGNNHDADYYEIYRTVMQVDLYPDGNDYSDHVQPSIVPYSVGSHFAWNKNRQAFEKTGEWLSTPSGLSQLRNYFYDDAGNLVKEWITIPGNNTKIDGMLVRVVKEYTPSGIQYSLRVDRGSLLAEDTIFESPLTEYRNSMVLIDDIEAIRDLNGKMPDGSTVEIRFLKLEDRISLSLSVYSQPLSFGAGQIFVTRSITATGDRYTVKLKGGDQMVATFESTVEPDASVAGKLVIQTAEGKVTFNLAAGTYTAEQAVFSEVYGKELLKQSTFKLVGDQLLNIYEILIDPATGKIPQRIRRDYASGGVPMAEFITRQAENGDEVTLTRFYNRTKGAWGNYSGTLRRNGGKRYMLTSTKPILSELSSGLMRQVEATLRDPQSGKTALVSVVFSKGSLMIDSCPAQWGNLTLCSAS
jgi:hypothetical protein